MYNIAGCECQLFRLGLDDVTMSDYCCWRSIHTIKIANYDRNCVRFLAKGCTFLERYPTFPFKNSSPIQWKCHIFLYGMRLLSVNLTWYTNWRNLRGFHSVHLTDVLNESVHVKPCQFNGNISGIWKRRSFLYCVFQSAFFENNPKICLCIEAINNWSSL